MHVLTLLGWVMFALGQTRPIVGWYLDALIMRTSPVAAVFVPSFLRERIQEAIKRKRMKKSWLIVSSPSSACGDGDFFAEKGFE